MNVDQLNGAIEGRAQALSHLVVERALAILATETCSYARFQARYIQTRLDFAKWERANERGWKTGSRIDLSGNSQRDKILQEMEKLRRARYQSPCKECVVCQTRKRPWPPDYETPVRKFVGAPPRKYELPLGEYQAVYEYEDTSWRDNQQGRVVPIRLVEGVGYSKAGSPFHHAQPFNGGRIKG